MSVLKRMTDKFSHLGLQSNKSAGSSSSLFPPGSSGSQNPSVNQILYSTDHRGSISTEATSSKSTTTTDAAADTSGFPSRSAREKGTYKLNDFVIHRTLGMGSFGRVHLGECFCSNRAVHPLIPAPSSSKQAQPPLLRH
jgi:protein kinase A